MRKILIALIVGCLAGVSVLKAQPNTHIKQYKDWQVKGFAKSALRMGDSQQAAVYLTEWLTRDTQNAKVAYLLAYCHEKNRMFTLAAHIYDSLYQASPRNNVFALYKLALMNKQMGFYDGALEQLTKLSGQSRKLRPYGVSKKQLEGQMGGCQMAIRWRDSLPKVGIERLNRSVNHSHKEMGPLILSDKSFVYGSTTLDTTAYMDPLGEHRPLNTIYLATLDSGTWTGGHLPTPPSVAMENHDWEKGVYSLDRQRYYSSYCAPNLKGKMQCKIYVSEHTDHGWTAPQPLGRVVNHPRYSSSQPTIGTCYNPKLEVLYFTSDRPGGAGRKDIWYAVYNKQTGRFDKAQNAGVFINTSADEMSPFYDLTSHRLFFSSDGWPGIGGLDIFCATGELVSWEEPVNIGVPINSSFDDLDYTQSESGKMGLIASNRPESLEELAQACCDDIFLFSEQINPRVRVTGRLRKNVKEQNLTRLLGKGAELLADTTNVNLAHKIITIHTVRDSSTMVFLKQTVTDENGDFSVWVDKGGDYKITVKDSTLLATTFDFTTKQPSVDDSPDLQIEVAPLTAKPTKAIAINNVYYEFGSAELTHASQEVLDTTVVAILKKYPNISVEIGSHTDDKGGEKFNLKLSDRRAANVVAYLIKCGVSANRLTYRGYGMSQPVAPNSNPDGSDNPQGRQQNRRTEFKIVGVVEE